MSEGIQLPNVPRETALDVPTRVDRLRAAIPQVLAALEGETDAVAIQSTLACLLFATFAQANWCGFYRRIGDHTLAVGPYQSTVGGMGCLRIDFARGVCGACASSGEVQLVPDVDELAHHIACDDRTRSELVVPVTHAGRLHAVLDLDSPLKDGFSREEADLLLALVNELFGRHDVVW